MLIKWAVYGCTDVCRLLTDLAIVGLTTSRALTWTVRQPVPIPCANPSDRASDPSSGFSQKTTQNNHSL